MLCFSAIIKRELLPIPLGLSPSPRELWLPPLPPWFSQTQEAWQKDLRYQILSQGSTPSSSFLPGVGCPQGTAGGDIVLTSLLCPSPFGAASSLQEALIMWALPSPCVDTHRAHKICHTLLKFAPGFEDSRTWAMAAQTPRLRAKGL